MKLEYSGYIKDDKVLIRNRKQLDAEILAAGWKEFEITIEKKKKHRSVFQNRYWWAIMTLIGNEIGYTKDEIHEIAKFKFLKGEKVNEQTGEVYEYLKSTTELTTSEFMSLVDSVIIWAAEMKIEIPLPNTQLSLTTKTG